jgi:predicted RNase H-like nuclease
MVKEASLADVIGVDGCARGWIAASQDASGTIACRRVETLAELFGGSARPRVVAVDVPIGLLRRGARECDVEARRLLGIRRSSVFPRRPTRRPCPQRGGVSSIQTWAIVPKVVQIDCFLRADTMRRQVVREVHPEVSFFYLNGGRPMRMPKRTEGGHADRVSALRSWCGLAIVAALAWREELACKATTSLTRSWPYGLQSGSRGVRLIQYRRRPRWMRMAFGWRSWHEPGASTFRGRLPMGYPVAALHPHGGRTKRGADQRRHGDH